MVTAGGGQASKKEGAGQVDLTSVGQAGELCLQWQESGGKSVGHSEREGWERRCPESLMGNRRSLDERNAEVRGLPWMTVRHVALLSSQSLPAGGFSYLSACPGGVTDHLEYCFAFSAWTCSVLPTGKGIFHQHST